AWRGAQGVVIVLKLRVNVPLGDLARLCQEQQDRRRLSAALAALASLFKQETGAKSPRFVAKAFDRLHAFGVALLLGEFGLQHAGPRLLVASLLGQLLL